MTNTKDLPQDAEEESGQASNTPFNNIERYFNEIVPKSWLRDLPTLRQLESRFEMRTPCIDIIDNEGEIVIKAEVPGIEKKDLICNVSNGSVVIKGETSTQTSETNEDYLHSEIHRGSFLRTIPLPCVVDPDGARATFKEGILLLRLPKLIQSSSRKIDIE